jgi:hypothetical protein
VTSGFETVGIFQFAPKNFRIYDFFPPFVFGRPIEEERKQVLHSLVPTLIVKKGLRGFSPRVDYIDQATAACRQS